MGSDAFMDRMHRAGEFPPAWRPDAGEILVGRLIDFAPAVGTAYGPCDVAHVEREDGAGAVSVWIGHAVLKREWQAVAPRLGERVGIRYLGQKETPDGKHYKAYAVRVDRAETVQAPPPPSFPEIDPLPPSQPVVSTRGDLPF